ncbi:MAG: DUF4830 domain-containing protein [Clostridia bacterium]|nr:DUF4830 domain-containing protein [Clostridia bacterium]
MKAFICRYPKNHITDILLSLFCIFTICLILQNSDTKNIIYCYSENERIDFLNINGWVVDESTGEYSEISLPNVIDETFEEYIELQKEQGFDLMPYIGKSVQKYTYEVLNYPGYENSGGIFATIFVYSDKIIAADIYSAAIDGFIQGVIS